jgi:hypothetical protein
MDYNFLADFLNKYSQLTPWVQAIVAGGMIAALVAPFYFLKEIVRVIAHRNTIVEPKKEWRDKYYRGTAEEPKT